MNSRIVSLILFYGMICNAARAAETLSVVPDSAQALGIVGGRFANLHDASAVRVSPANILEIQQPELLVNLAAWKGDIQLDASSGAKVQMSRPWVFPASIYGVLPLDTGRLAVGIGISTPFGLASVYPRDMDLRLRYVLPYESSLLAVNITPAVAYKVTDNLRVAIGLDVIYSDLQLKQIYPWSVPVPGSPDGEVKFHGKGWGLGAYLGVNWTPTKGHRVALIGRLPVRIRYKGDFTTQGMPAVLAAGGFTETSRFDTELTYPGSVGLGYGIDLSEQWTLGFDFQWSANSSHDDLPLQIGNNQALLPSNSAPFGWQNSIDLGTGVSYKIDDNWTVRSGYLFSENSQPALNYTPSAAVYDRHVFSLGVGWRGKTCGVDLTYAYVYNPTRTISGASQPAFNGNYRQRWHVLSLSVTRRF
ncbi:MAG: outer membrane protein transport protein [Prosthecobacter sp.]